MNCFSEYFHQRTHTHGEREGERERERDIYTCMYTHAHTHTRMYIYIYMYVCTYFKQIHAPSFSHMQAGAHTHTSFLTGFYEVFKIMLTHKLQCACKWGPVATDAWNLEPNMVWFGYPGLQVSAPPSGSWWRHRCPKPISPAKWVPHPRHPRAPRASRAHHRREDPQWNGWGAWREPGWGVRSEPRLFVWQYHISYIICPIQETLVVWQHGHGSIPINTIFRGMNIHLQAILMFTRGTRFWPIPALVKRSDDILPRPSKRYPGRLKVDPWRCCGAPVLLRISAPPSPKALARAVSAVPAATWHPGRNRRSMDVNGCKWMFIMPWIMLLIFMIPSYTYYRNHMESQVLILSYQSPIFWSEPHWGHSSRPTKSCNARDDANGGVGWSCWVHPGSWLHWLHPNSEWL